MLSRGVEDDRPGIRNPYTRDRCAFRENAGPLCLASPFALLTAASLSIHRSIDRSNIFRSSVARILRAHYARLRGSNTFRKNDAYWGGAIFNNPFGDTLFNFEQVEETPASVVRFPKETVFDGNTAKVKNK